MAILGIFIVYPPPQIRLAGLVYHEAMLLVKGSKRRSQRSSFATHTGSVSGATQDRQRSEGSQYADSPLKPRATRENLRAFFVCKLRDEDQQDQKNETLLLGPIFGK